MIQIEGKNLLASVAESLWTDLRLPQRCSKTGLSQTTLLIFFSHLHPDHVAGAIDAEGSAVFKNASFKITDLEYNFWTSDTFTDSEVNGNDWAGLARTALSAYKIKSKLFPSVKILFQVLLPLAYQDTHLDILVSGLRMGQTLIQMEIFYVPNLQLENPSISTVFDVDSVAALKSRKEILDMVSTDRLLCTSGHMIQPKFGYIEKSGGSYRIAY